MTPDLSEVRALTFDVGGTVFDWHHSIRDEVLALAAARGVTIDGAAFANEWRRGMFQQLGRVRSGELSWMNADELHRLALDEVADHHPELALSSADREELNRVWHRLQAWEDAPAAIEQLRSRYTVVVLTVLSWSIVVDSSRHAGVTWDGILSCEFLGHYKPDPGAYEAGVRLLGLQPQQVMMVAAHSGDLRAAMAAGLRSAYVARPLESGAAGADGAPLADFGEAAAPEDFTVNAADFSDLVRQLMH